MTAHRRNAANLLAGFTLVEILVVIVIIGLLAGMTTTVVVSARRSVNNSIVSAQMSQLSIALDEYKNRFGEYPPDLSDQIAVMRHIKKRWPRYHVQTYDEFIAAIQAGSNLSSGGEHVWDVCQYVSPLVFWLGGLPDQHGVPSGFYASPKYPLGISAENGNPIARPDRAKKEKPFFTFDKKYLRACVLDGSGAVALIADGEGSIDAQREYIPAYCQGGFPLVYFKPSVGVPYADKYFRLAASEGVSCAMPYASEYREDKNRLTWYEENRFQIMHPGSDGIFGADAITCGCGKEHSLRRIIPIEKRPPKDDPSRDESRPVDGITLEDADNLTNFVESGTLESMYDD